MSTPTKPGTLGSLTVKELKTLISEKGLQLPTSGSGKNGSVIKSDLVSVLSKAPQSKSPKKKQSALGDDFRSILPPEMAEAISLRVATADIANLCKTDSKFKDQCTNLNFWRAYLRADQSLFELLVKTLIDQRENSLFLLLWKNIEQIGVKREGSVYLVAYREAMKLKDENLALQIWRLAPMEYRSRFHQNIVDKINKFLKKYEIGPNKDSEEFWFRKIPKSEEEYDDYQYEMYGDIEPIDDWEKISKMILFTGQYYQLATRANYPLGLLYELKENLNEFIPYIDTKGQDIISRAFRSGTDVTVVDVLKSAYYLSYDTIMEVTNKIGMIESLEIDESSDYPKLIIEFKVS